MMKRPESYLPLLFACLISALATTSSADQITFYYSGTITNVGQFNIDLFPGAAPGNQVRGSITYSTDPLEYDQVDTSVVDTTYRDETPIEIFHWTFSHNNVTRELTDVPDVLPLSRGYVLVNASTNQNAMIFSASAGDELSNGQTTSTTFQFLLGSAFNDVFNDDLPPAHIDLNWFGFNSGYFDFIPDAQSFVQVQFQLNWISRPGDVNGDGEINLLDINPFIQTLSDGKYSVAADSNLDGTVNLLDIDGFVAALAGG